MARSLRRLLVLALEVVVAPGLAHGQQAAYVASPDHLLAAVADGVAHVRVTQHIDFPDPSPEDPQIAGPEHLATARRDVAHAYALQPMKASESIRGVCDSPVPGELSRFDRGRDSRQCVLTTGTGFLYMAAGTRLWLDNLIVRIVRPTREDEDLPELRVLMNMAKRDADQTLGNQEAFGAAPSLWMTKCDLVGDGKQSLGIAGSQARVFASNSTFSNFALTDEVGPAVSLAAGSDASFDGCEFERNAGVPVGRPAPVAVTGENPGGAKLACLQFTDCTFDANETAALRWFRVDSWPGCLVLSNDAELVVLDATKAVKLTDSGPDGEADETRFLNLSSQWLTQVQEREAGIQFIDYIPDGPGLVTQSVPPPPSDDAESGWLRTALFIGSICLFGLALMALTIVAVWATRRHGRGYRPPPDFDSSRESSKQALHSQQTASGRPPLPANASALITNATTAAGTTTALLPQDGRPGSHLGQYASDGDGDGDTAFHLGTSAQRLDGDSTYNPHSHHQGLAEVDVEAAGASGRFSTLDKMLQDGDNWEGPMGPDAHGPGLGEGEGPSVMESAAPPMTVPSSPGFSTQSVTLPGLPSMVSVGEAQPTTWGQSGGGSGEAPRLAIEALSAQITNLRVTNTPLLSRFYMLGPERQWETPLSIVQCARADEQDYAVEFFLSASAMANKLGWYRNPPVAGMLPSAILTQQAHLVVTDRMNSEPVTLPPFVIVEDHYTLWSSMRNARLKYVRVLQVLMDVVDRLKELHNQDHVHGGLSPMNIIWLQNSTRWSITGFSSLAKKGKEIRFPEHLHYSPPEVAQAQHKGRRGCTANPATDVWAIGVIAIELLAGRPAFSAELTHEEVSAALLGKQKLPWEGQSDDAKKLRSQLTLLKDSVLECVSRKPEDRPSVSQLEELWEEVFDATIGGKV